MSISLRAWLVGCAVELTDCFFTYALVLAGARARAIDLSGSVLKTLDATGAEVAGPLILDRCQAQAILLDHA
jgi:hypothetical protein